MEPRDVTSEMKKITLAARIILFHFKRDSMLKQNTKIL